MQKALLALALLAVIVVSGCTSTDLSGFAKALPEVQSFLESNPNADVRVALWPQTAVEAELASIQEACGAPVAAAALYKVDIIDTNLDVTMWIDATTRQPVCIIKRGVPPSPNPPADDDACEEAGGLWYNGKTRCLPCTSPEGNCLAVCSAGCLLEPTPKDRCEFKGLRWDAETGRCGDDKPKACAELDERACLAAERCIAVYKEIESDDRGKDDDSTARTRGFVACKERAPAVPDPIVLKGDYSVTGALYTGQTAKVALTGRSFAVTLREVSSERAAVIDVDGAKRTITVGEAMSIEGLTVTVKELVRSEDRGKGFFHFSIPHDDEGTWFVVDQAHTITVSGISFKIVARGAPNDKEATLEVNGERISVVAGETYTFQGLTFRVKAVEKERQKVRILFLWGVGLPGDNETNETDNSTNATPDNSTNSTTPTPPPANGTNSTNTTPGNATTPTPPPSNSTNSTNNQTNSTTPTPPPANETNSTNNQSNSTG